MSTHVRRKAVPVIDVSPLLARSHPPASASTSTSTAIDEAQQALDVLLTLVDAPDAVIDMVL
jgi:hypothetical protein